MAADKLKIFISYSRRDYEVAGSLVETLEAQGFSVTIDRRDLPYGEEWQAELADFIRTSDTVLWLVSPDSIGSRWVNWELGEVGRLSKRLVPLTIKAIVPEDLPESLGKINLLPSEGTYDPAVHFAALVTTLHTDQAWVKEGTRLLDRTREWKARSGNASLLLRGPALKSAELWSARRPQTAPAPPGEVLELILESRKAAARRQRWAVGGSLAAAVAGIGLAVFGGWQAYVAQTETALANANEKRAVKGEALAKDQTKVAENQTKVATAQTVRANENEARAVKGEALAQDNEKRAVDGEARAFKGEQQALLNQSRFLTKEADAAVANGDATLGVQLALGALPDTKSDDDITKRRPYWQPAEYSLFNAIRAQRELRVFSGHTGAVTSVAVTQDGTRIVTGSLDNAARVWDAGSGKPLISLIGHADKIWSVAVTPDNAKIVTGSYDGTARIWNANTGKELLKLNGNGGEVLSVAVSQDGARIVTGSYDGYARVWDAATGKMLLSFLGRDPLEGGTTHESDFLSIAMTPDGKRIVTGSEGKEARVFDAATGAQILTLTGHKGSVYSVALTPDGSRIVTGSADHSAKIWDATTGKELMTLTGHLGEVSSIAVTRDGLHIVTGSIDKTVRV